jgi:dsDNA-binding SOS-regulon protein
MESEHTFTYDSVVEETDKAYLFEVDTLEVWIPKSEMTSHDKQNLEVTIPIWLARQKGLAD